MKIFEIRFTDAEWAALHALAGAVLMRRGMDCKGAVDHIKALTPPNVLRLALGLAARHRGGARVGAGRPKEKEKVKE